MVGKVKRAGQAQFQARTEISTATHIQPSRSATGVASWVAKKRSRDDGRRGLDF
jgi:hypothetical protein